MMPATVSVVWYCLGTVLRCSQKNKAPAPMATVANQNRYMVTPSIESPALSAFIVVDMSASVSTGKFSANNLPCGNGPPICFSQLAVSSGHAPNSFSVLV